MSDFISETEAENRKEDKAKFAHAKLHPLDSHKLAMAESVVSAGLVPSPTLNLSAQTRFKLAAIRIFETNPHKQPSDTDIITKLILAHYEALSEFSQKSMDTADDILEAEMIKHKNSAVKKSSIFSNDSK